MASNVIDYVLEKYPKTFKNKEILVEENDVCYFVSTNKDESPLILNKRYEQIMELIVRFLSWSITRRKIIQRRKTNNTRILYTIY